MANRQWLEEVKRRLVENGLPPRYIRRFMEELADHLEDLMEEKMSKETNCLSQLGQPSQVADMAVVAYQQRTFFGRHPMAKFLVFGVSPLFTLLLTLGLAVFGLILCTELFEYFGMDKQLTRFFTQIDPSVLRWIAATVTLILPTMLLAVFYCRWVRRSDLGRKWMWISCGILSMLSLLIIYQVTVSEIPGESQLRIGAGLGPDMLPHTVLQYVQMLTPLAVGLWFMRQSRTNKPTDSKESFRAAA